MKKFTLLPLFLLFASVFAIEIPIIVTILNVEPEILSESIPAQIVMDTPFTASVTVRENNTLDDICHAYAIINGENVSASVENVVYSNGLPWIGDYVFRYTLTTPLVSSCSIDIYIGDEEFTLRRSYTVPVAEKISLVLVTKKVSFALKPGTVQSKSVKAHITSNVPTDLYAATNGSLDIWLSGIKLGAEPVLVAGFPSMDDETVLNLTLSVPEVMLDGEQRFAVGIYLCERGGDVGDVYTALGIRLREPLRIDPFWLAVTLSLVLGALFLLIVGRRYG